jgi:pimeloyl-ACP methyl ester carboxylesterase
MQKITILLLISLISVCNKGNAQSEISFKWWDPIHYRFPVIEGQAWPNQTEHPYDRLPERIKGDVRKVVWEKSQESAGLIISFCTNAPEIQVRYHVKNKFEFEHMPATGVSGLDLYSMEKNGSWRWTGANYSFGDTIYYSYPALQSGSKQYYLYLPLYNKVEWLEIGVAKEAEFVPVKARMEQPIVIYGTSITQGGCASRPGMAWTAQLGRKLYSPIINLGFSSNGVLEESLIKLMAEIDAKIYILDCLPNLTSFDENTITTRIIESVKYLQSKKPGTPILFTDHADANIGLLDTSLDTSFKKINNLMHTVFVRLKSAGVQNIYLLTSDVIGLDNESTVDGQHPNDLGMQRYALAYEKKIREIWSGQGKKDKNIQLDSIVHSNWLGFSRMDFLLNGRACILVEPENPADGNPWIWRTEFFGHEPQADSMLVSNGFHLAYIDVQDMYGAPAAIDRMKILYQYLIHVKGLNNKPVLEGFSRGGLFALNWAATYPDRVKCLYLDAPVCDFKSWPGGRGESPKFPDDWEKLKKVYGFADDKQALEYRYNPIDNLAPLAKYKIPILSVCGANDSVVPMIENTSLLEKRYKMLDGEIKVISKPGVGHHPHSLKNPEPVVSFILEKTKE